MTGASACFSDGAVANPTPHPGQSRSEGEVAAEIAHPSDEGDGARAPAAGSAWPSDTVSATDTADSDAADAAGDAGPLVTDVAGD
ncbi:MAG: hypothetical protein ACPGU1_01635 [Myxococcota bacterium]